MLKQIRRLRGSGFERTFLNYKNFLYWWKCWLNMHFSKLIKLYVYLRSMHLPYIIINQQSEERAELRCRFLKRGRSHQPTSTADASSVVCLYGHSPHSTPGAWSLAYDQKKLQRQSQNTSGFICLIKHFTSLLLLWLPSCVF